MDNLIRLWDLGNSEQTRELSGHDGAVWSAVFGPDGKQVVSASADQTLKVWDVESGKAVHTLKGHASAVTAAVWSPDGKYILSCGGDKVLKLWDAAKGTEVRTYEGHTGVVTAAAFDKDGKRFVSCGADRLVKVWDVEGKPLHSFAKHRGVVAAVAFAPDGKSVASAGADQAIKIWTLADGKDTTLTGHGSGIARWRTVPTADDSPRPAAITRSWSGPWAQEVTKVNLLGHTGPISSLAWSNDGRFLASGGADQVIKLWDVQNRRAGRKEQPPRAQGLDYLGRL